MPQQHFLSRDQVIWSFGPDLQPVLEVEPGDTVTFQTNDCFTGQIRSESDLVTEIDLSRINSATGPVAVRGAEPGDSLIAEILDVRPIEWGVATLIPGFGQLIEHVKAPPPYPFKYANWIAIGWAALGVALTAFVSLRQPERLADMNRVYVEDETISPPDAAAAFPVA